jgi:hypothetical protein
MTRRRAVLLSDGTVEIKDIGDDIWTVRDRPETLKSPWETAFRQSDEDDSMKRRIIYDG